MARLLRQRRAVHRGSRQRGERHLEWRLRSGGQGMLRRCVRARQSPARQPPARRPPARRPLATWPPAAARALCRRDVLRRLLRIGWRGRPCCVGVHCVGVHCVGVHCIGEPAALCRSMARVSMHGVVGRWPDGVGTFSLENATSWTVHEQLVRMDQLDWTEGLLLRQVCDGAPTCDLHLRTRSIAFAPSHVRRARARPLVPSSSARPRLTTTHASARVVGAAGTGAGRASGRVRPPATQWGLLWRTRRWHLALALATRPVRIQLDGPRRAAASAMGVLERRGDRERSRGDGLRLLLLPPNVRARQLCELSARALPAARAHAVGGSRVPLA